MSRRRILLLQQQVLLHGCAGRDEPYAPLVAALRDSGKAGIGRFTFHNREYRSPFTPREDRLVLHTAVRRGDHRAG